MKNRKIVGLLLSITLVLVLALPATLAMPTDSGEDVASDSNCAPETDDVVVDENTEADESEDNFENMEDVETDEDAENDEMAEEVDLITDGVSVSDVVYAEETTGVEEIASASNAAPSTTSVFVHLVTCVDGCTGEGCECECHLKNLFERLMNCSVLEDLLEIIEMASDDELAMLTSSERRAIDERIIELEPEPTPTIVVGESNGEVAKGEIIYSLVSFKNVAPLGDPIMSETN